jgi:hypothetical protein
LKDLNNQVNLGPQWLARVSIRLAADGRQCRDAPPVARDQRSKVDAGDSIGVGADYPIAD